MHYLPKPGRFLSHKIYLLALLSHFTDRNDRFPSPFIIILQQVKSLPFHVPDLKTEKGNPFGWCLPIQAIVGRYSSPVIGHHWEYPGRSQPPRHYILEWSVNVKPFVKIKSILMKFRVHPMYIRCRPLLFYKTSSEQVYHHCSKCLFVQMGDLWLRFLV